MFWEREKDSVQFFLILTEYCYINWNVWWKYVQYLQSKWLKRVNKGGLIVVNTSKTKKLTGEFFCTVEAFQVKSTTWHTNKCLGAQIKAPSGEVGIQCPTPTAPACYRYILILCSRRDYWWHYKGESMAHNSLAAGRKPLHNISQGTLT